MEKIHLQNMSPKHLQDISPKERDIYFLREAFKSARDLSQDINTQTGAILVSPALEIISHGANRMHFGLQERYDGDGKRILLGRPEKYDLLTHAERDAIFVANRNGVSLFGYTLYATWAPCEFCAEVVINNGLSRFVTHQSTTDWYSESLTDIKNRPNWQDSINKAINKLKNAGLKYECLTNPIGEVELLFVDKIRAP
jgi:dCMP deaminase